MDTTQYQQAFFEDAKAVLAPVAAIVTRLRDNTVQPDDLFELRRAFHTLKSNAGLMGFMDISALALRMEEFILERVNNHTPFTADDITTVAEAYATVQQQLKDASTTASSS